MYKRQLTSRVVENKFVVVDELKLDEIKTKKFVEVLKNLNVEKALVVLNLSLIHILEAAENGKEVIVLVELRARFDEANNIEMSHRLEDAGCQIPVSYTHLDVYKRQM